MAPLSQELEPPPYPARFKVLSETFNYDNEEVAADPVHVMYVLEQALKREQFPEEVERSYLEFIKAELAPRYAEFIGNEIQKAYLESYTEYGQNLFDRYIAYADAWIEETDYKDPDTGQMFDREILDAELSKIEKPAGIANPKYPQKQTKVMNEGCATFVHYYVVNALYDAGRLDEGALLEILHSHSNVVSQPSYDDRRFGGLNPYALGFEMMADIKRICAQPTREDETWFPEFAGCDDWRAVLREARANFRDESFIQQYLSPHLMRKLRLFLVADDAKDSHFTVSGIHDERRYRKVRTALARTYDPGVNEPEIQVVDADLRGDRRLRLQQTVLDGVPLAEPSRDDVMELVRRLWGHEVSLVGIDADTSRQLYETSTD